MSFLRRLLGGDDEPAEPTLAPASPSAAGGEVDPVSTELPFDVVPIKGEWHYTIDFDDVVAHVEEDRVQRFIELLDAEPGVEQAVQEDREVILVKAKRMSETAMRAAAIRAWTTAGEQVGVKTLEEWEREQES